MRVEMPVEGRRRVVIVDVEPAVDAGRRPSKGEVGLPIQVRARLVADGHDRLRAWCRWRGPDGGILARSPLSPGQDDWWSCEFTPAEAGR
ncbi:MAG: maltotransferase domain-containing protein, partial [Clostridia bacterium]